MSEEASILAQDLAEGTKFYTTAKDHETRLKETFYKGKQPGETTYIQTLDEILTLRMGFIYCFTGWPGSGKSEFITQLSVLQANFKKRKVAFYSPESYPVDEFLDTFIHCYLGKSTDRRFPNVCSEKEYTDAIKWCNDYFMFCDWDDTPDCSKILNSFKFLKESKGVEIFVVDPFNSLETEGEEANIAVALKRNLTAVKRFAHQNRIMVWLVEHPKTASKPEEFDLNPGPRQLFGGTMWWNKVDVLLSVHRPNRDDKTDNQVIIRTWKVKRQQLNGRPGERIIHYDVRTNRYYEDHHCMRHPMNATDLYEEPERPVF
jgi:twinkle protein